jgi:signal transduction histidine kinase
MEVVTTPQSDGDRGQLSSLEASLMKVTKAMAGSRDGPGGPGMPEDFPDPRRNPPRIRPEPAPSAAEAPKAHAPPTPSTPLAPPAPPAPIICSLSAALKAQWTLLSDASHELRTPLAGLRARVEEARLYPDDVVLTDLFEGMLGDLDRMEAIIADLLRPPRPSPLPPRPLERVDLAELVRTEVARRTDRIPCRVRLERGVIVNAVRIQIARLLTNLLNNAQRHARTTVEVMVRSDGGRAELVVTDDGEGVPEADRERIFERFVRLPSARNTDPGGTGRGLAISREIARAHLGNLQAEGSADGGRFVLRLRTPPPE